MTTIAKRTRSAKRTVAAAVADRVFSVGDLVDCILQFGTVIDWLLWWNQINRTTYNVLRKSKPLWLREAMTLILRRLWLVHHDLEKGVVSGPSGRICVAAASFQAKQLEMQLKSPNTDAKAVRDYLIRHLKRLPYAHAILHRDCDKKCPGQRYCPAYDKSDEPEGEDWADAAPLDYAQWRPATFALSCKVDTKPWTVENFTSPGAIGADVVSAEDIGVHDRLQGKFFTETLQMKTLLFLFNFK